MADNATLAIHLATPKRIETVRGAGRRIHRSAAIVALAIQTLLPAGPPRRPATGVILGPESSRDHVGFFNSMVDEDVLNFLPNADAWSGMRGNVQYFSCPDAWDWHCLDNVAYHGRSLTILWDRTGARFGTGAGLRLFADGLLIGTPPALRRLTARF